MIPCSVFRMVFIASMQGHVTFLAVESTKLWYAHGANSTLTSMHDLPYLHSSIHSWEPTATPLDLVQPDGRYGSAWMASLGCPQCGGGVDRCARHRMRSALPTSGVESRHREPAIPWHSPVVDVPVGPGQWSWAVGDLDRVSEDCSFVVCLSVPGR
jgi:hypothetical protein